MGTKHQLAELLENSPGEFISGSEIAQRLGVTRAAIWKHIRQLETDGYVIEAVKNRGYRLSEESDAVSAAGVRRRLGNLADSFSLDVYDEVSSTNTVLKEKAPGLPQWHTVIAGTQSAGRGRAGRSFYSPPGTGLYISLLLRPTFPAEQAWRITTAAAVAVCRSVEECTGIQPGIKWVNDVFVAGKKICGILTEAAFDMETGGLDYAVLGVGINVYEPEGGFPPELRSVAGALFQQRQGHGLRNQLAACFLRHFRAIYESPDSSGFAQEYRIRSILLGREVSILRSGGRQAATALEIDENCRLLVRYSDGTEEALSSGEVSVRPMGQGAHPC